MKIIKYCMKVSYSLNINYNLTETDTDNFDIKSPLEQENKNQEVKDSG